MISGTPPTSPTLSGTPPPSTASFAPPGALAGPAPWSPKALAAISFFFTFLPAGIMYAINYERLGQPKKKLPAMLITVVAFLVFGVVVVATPDSGPFQYAFRGFHVAVAFFFLKRPQALPFQEYLVKGGKPGKLTKPILASLGFVVLLVGAMFAYGYMEADKAQAQYDAGFELINKGELAQAEALFLRLREEAPEDVDPYWGLANVYARMERYDEARAQLNKTLELAPDLQPAIDMRERLKAVAAEKVGAPAATP